MILPQPLPRTLFEELGKIVALWATIEQNVVLHCSAMAAQKTNGKTTDYLRFDFTRLRKIWFGLCRENFDTATFNKIVNPLNVEMVRLATQRGYAVHGIWRTVGRGKFELTCYEQKGQLVSFVSDVTIKELREIRHDSYLLSKRVSGFVSGDQDGEHVTRSRLKVVGENSQLEVR